MTQSQIQMDTLSLIVSRLWFNDLTIGWQNWAPLRHPHATLAPQAKQARASGENLNYVTLALQARQASGEILNYSLSCYSLVWYPSKIIDLIRQILLQHPLLKSDTMGVWWRGAAVNNSQSSHHYLVQLKHPHFTAFTHVLMLIQCF